AGWLLYKSGRQEEAGRSFDQAVRLQADGPIRLAALYWKGRSLEKAGEPQKAAALFEALCAEAPLTYYCHTARMRTGLAEMTSAVGGDGGGVSFSGLDPQDKAVTTDVHYQRAVELRLVGLLREAGEELGMLPGRIGGDRRAVLWLAGRRAGSDAGDAPDRGEDRRPAGRRGVQPGSFIRPHLQHQARKPVPGTTGGEIQPQSDLYDRGVQCRPRCRGQMGPAARRRR